MSHFWWIVDLGCRNSSRVASHWRQWRGHLSSDTLLTERILGDEALDIVTPSTTSSAPKNPLSQGIVCCKDGCFCAISSHVIMWVMADKYKDDLGVFRAPFWAVYMQIWLIAIVRSIAIVWINCANDSASFHAHCHSKLARTSARVQVTKKAQNDRKNKRTNITYKVIKISVNILFASQKIGTNFAPHSSDKEGTKRPQK